MTQKEPFDNRSRILNAAEKLLHSMSRDAITIRAVADEAKVQAPTIYRLFQDKGVLLDAVAEQGFLRYMDSNQGYVRSPNLIDELRNGWDFHVRFGMNNPELYALMYDRSHYPDISPAAAIAHEGFKELITQLAEAGHLKVDQEQALFIIFASAAGTVRSLSALPKPESIEAYCKFIRESMITDVTVQPASRNQSGITNAAVTLRANIDNFDQLSPAEKALLQEWLRRLS